MSPPQVMRKALHYLAFGVYPLVCTAPVAPAFHDYVYEAISAVPKVLFVDHDAQSDTSEEARRLRAERVPRE